VSGQPKASAAVPPKKEPSIAIGEEVGLSSELVWTTWRVEERCTSSNWTTIIHDHSRSFTIIHPEAVAVVTQLITDLYSVALSPQANYTDWSTATCRRILVPTFADRGVSPGKRGGSPTVVNLNFLDRSRYFHSSSSSFILKMAEWTRSRPTATQKIW
jgi:hypothetical protein